MNVYPYNNGTNDPPLNAVDIALLVGTTTDVPYDDLTELANSNSVATIDDQR